MTAEEMYDVINTKKNFNFFSKIMEFLDEDDFQGGVACIKDLFQCDDELAKDCLMVYKEKFYDPFKASFTPEDRARFQAEALQLEKKEPTSLNARLAHPPTSRKSEQARGPHRLPCLVCSARRSINLLNVKTAVILGREPEVSLPAGVLETALSERAALFLSWERPFCCETLKYTVSLRFF